MGIMQAAAIEARPALGEASDDTPTGRDLWALFAAAILVRVIFLAIMGRLRHQSFPQLAYWGDCRAYLEYAKLILGRPAELSTFEQRIFPGFSAAVALLHLLGIPLWIAGFAVAWLSSGVAAVAGAALFRSRRMGMVLVFLVPDYVIASALPDAEPLMLALMLLGLQLALGEHLLAGGIALGLAGVCRPMACFAVLGYMLHAMMHGRWRRGIVVGAAALAVVALALLGVRHWLGEALRGVRIYAAEETFNGSMIEWPFVSLVRTPFVMHVWPLKIAGVWLHVLVVLLACGMLARRFFSARRQALDVLCLPWLLGNTAFILCVGSIWGFHCFPRYLVPALPPLAWQWRKWLPRGWPAWVGIGAFSVAGAVVMGLRR